MDLFANEHYTHPRAFANILQHVCQSLLDTIFAPYVRYIHVWDRPHWSPSTMSTAALTHYAKIRGVHRKKLQTFEMKEETQRVKGRETMLTTASFTNTFTHWERIPVRPPEAAT